MLRVGIVGCGNIAQTHAWALSRLEEVKLVAFADIIIQRAREISDKYASGESKIYDNLEEMLQKEKLDVLHICTPHHLHVPMALKAIAFGVAVFSEKPPAINMEQFGELERMAKDTGVVVGFCFQNRFNKTIEKTDALIESGELGKVIGARGFVTWRRDEDYYATDWKGFLNTEGGGALINQSIHTLDLILRYLGKPDMVKAGLSNYHLEGKIEVEDTVNAWMTFEGGKRVCFYASTAYVTDAPVILEIQCEKGSITIIDNCLTIRRDGTETEVLTVKEDEVLGKSYWGNGHLKCMRDFYQSLKDKTAYQNDIAGVKNTMETMMKIYDFR